MFLKSPESVLSIHVKIISLTLKLAKRQSFFDGQSQQEILISAALHALKTKIFLAPSVLNLQKSILHCWIALDLLFQTLSQTCF